MPTEARQTTVLLPKVIDFQLYYDHDYNNGLGKYDYLQMVRSRNLFAQPHSKQREETYWADLQQNRTDFVAGLNEPFDLIVDAPSNSGYHRPYLSAFIQQAVVNVPVVRFLKNTPVRSCPENLADLRANIKAFGNIQGQLGAYMNVLVVDDVFSSGTILTVVIEKLIAAGLSEDAALTLACPLRMPPNNNPGAAEIAAIMQGQQADEAADN